MTSLESGLGIGLFDDANIQNPYPLYEQMHRAGPVHRMGDSGFYAVSSWDAVTEAISRCSDFSSNLTATMMFQPGGTIAEFPVGELGGAIQALATADDPAHAIHRKAILPQLAAKRIRAFEPFIAQTAEELWDINADNSIEWMSAMANKLPMMIVGRIIGVPDDDIDALIRWGYSATQVVEGLVSPSQLEAAGTAVLELGGYVTDQFDRAAADPGDNLLGDLATACATGELDSTAALTMMVTLFSAGGESTASLIGSAAWILANHSDIQSHLRQQSELLTAFLEEVLRYEPPFRSHYRHVVTDTELHGVALPAGSRLILLWGAANRDPSHFDEPAQFRLDRPTAKNHIAFGKGIHFCVGAALARLEARIVIDHLIRHSNDVTATDTGRWLPSLLVRRLERLRLAIT